MVLVHVHRFPNKQTKIPTRNPPHETVGAVPMCPPERPRSGVSISKTHALCAGNERWMRPCGATRAGTQAPPLPISIKHCGVPLSIVHSIAHANRTVCPYPIGVILFDSAGLASATQPTLGNNASEEATPLGVVLFLIAHHYHTRRMDHSQMISPHEN